MAPVLSIDIHAVLTSLGKADGDSVSAAELGVSLLTNAVAGTLPNGQRCIKSNGSSNLIFRPEATATAAARGEDYYAVRYNLRAETSGEITPANTADFFRHAGTADPRFHISVNTGHVAFAARHGAVGGNVHQFSSSQNATDGRNLPFNESAEVTWFAVRSGTAATDFVGLFVDGTCVAATSELQAAVTFSNANFCSLPNTANLTWQIHGLLEVYSTDDYEAEGLLEPPDGAYRIQQAFASLTAFLPPGVTISDSGITRADERQNVGAGINIGDHAITLTGTTGSGETVTYRPPTAPTFSAAGFLTVRARQIQSAELATVTVRARDTAGTNIARVQIRDDAIDGSVIEYSVGAGAFVGLASGITLTGLYVVQFQQRSDGRVVIQVKDDTIVNTTDGAVWSVVVETGHTTPIRQIQIARTGTYISSTVTRRGHVEWLHRPVLGIYTDSWTSGDAGGAPQNQVPNHITAMWRGSRIGECFRPLELGPVVGGADPLAFSTTGNEAWGRRGWSTTNWASASADLPDHVMGSLCIVGVSCMNTMDQNESAINAGGAGLATLLTNTINTYVDICTRLLANSNTVWFCGFVPPPVGSFSGRGPTTEAMSQFCADASAGIVEALRLVTVPEGSVLAISDVHAYAVDVQAEDPATDWIWDTAGIHLSTTFDQVYADYARASVELRGYDEPTLSDRSRDNRDDRDTRMR
jgi:hypothetical protein